MALPGTAETITAAAQAGHGAAAFNVIQPEPAEAIIASAEAAQAAVILPDLRRSAVGRMPLVASSRLQLAGVTDDPGVWWASCPAPGVSLMVPLFLLGPGRDQQEHARNCVGHHPVPGAFPWPT